MLPQTERLVLSQSSALSPNYLLFGPFVSDTSTVEATWKYICDNKDKYLPHSPNAARCLDFWFGQNWDLCCRELKEFVKLLDLSYFCSADNLDFLTLGRCHLSVLGLLRNNCQFISQVGVAERARIVFFCRQILILWHAVHWIWIWCKRAISFVWKWNLCKT